MSRRHTYVAVFLVAAATLVLEILLTRITSVVAWYHLAFFVISLAMLGMTAGAVLVFMRPQWFPDERVGERMAQASIAFSLAMPLAMRLALSIALSPIADLAGFVAMLSYGCLLALPFAVGGVVLTLALTRAGLPEGVVYGVDLCGAAFGCAAVVPLLAWIDAPSAVFVAAAVAALAGWGFARGAGVSPKLQRAGWLAAIALSLSAVVNVAADGALLRPQWIKGFPEVPSRYSFIGWNTYSRVTVDQQVEFPPTFWAAGRTIPPEMMRAIPQRWLLIDGAAGTSMAGLDTTPDDGQPGSPAEHEYLSWDVTAFAHAMRPRGPAAVIGVGGGRDVLEAARVGHEPVVGIELNGLIVALHRNVMREFSGLADLPGVELVEDEARSFLARDRRSYAVITMSLIDTWAATGAGAYALSENGLYTVEGWKIFMRRLQQDGIFTVSRWYKPDSPGETARMLALAYETLWQLGVEKPRGHVILLQNQHIATLLMSPTPFTGADLDHMQKVAVTRGFNMMLTPRKLPSNPLLREVAELPDSATLERWSATQLLDLSAPTDARPFFFNMLRPATWFAPPPEIDELDLGFLGNLHATQTLVYATLASALLTLLAVVVPLAWRRRALAGYRRGDLLTACAYFSLIGLGFMFVEMGLLSRLNVFLGHPTLALAVLLGGIIFFTGMGSLLSSRVRLGAGAGAKWFPLLPAVGIAVVGFALDPVMHALSASATPVRVLTGVSLVAVAALGMGLCFPLGLRLCERIGGGDKPPLGPWMWGLNGACGVVASGLALTSSMAWGIPATLAIGAGCYVALVACTLKLSAARQ
ncbi:MAG: hypothetical protein IPK74_29680 [Deltaproteobacteria bacterium]|nr:hypothetical protein [Deltaproteobacteria bacterium]